MALLYSKQTADSLYEVRNAGASLRLYSNGVLHSQYNKNTPINGAIWDLLLLPGFLAPRSPKRILVLGLGGGTIVHLLRRFFPESHITCVELDREHITIAKQFFLIPTENVKVVHADAYDFLKDATHKQKGEKQKFDWIIDDVFQHLTGEPKRVKAVSGMTTMYLSCLQKNGLLSINVIGSKQKKQLKNLMPSFVSAYQFNHPLYENSIVSLNRFDASTAQFRINLKQHKMLDQTYKTCKLNYRLQRFWMMF